MMALAGVKTKKKFKAADHWGTPAWCVEGLLKVNPPSTKVIVEPSAGDGAIVRVLARHQYNVIAVEKDVSNSRYALLKAAGAETIMTHDWLFWDERRSPYSIIGNPPWTPGREMLDHVLHALRLLNVAPNTRWSRPVRYVAMLLPTRFLCGQKRHEYIHHDYPLQGIHPLNPRPKFAGAGGSEDCCWFVWQGGPKVIEPVDGFQLGLL